MSDDLSELPIKSLELPTKTVAKLKPLGVKTIAQLYAVPLPRLVEIGLTPKELATLAEAAPDFGVRWHAPEAIAAAAPAESVKAASKAKPAAKTQVPSSTLSPSDAEALALISRLVTIRDTSIGGPERWYAIALVDVSRLPEVDALEPRLLEVSARVAALLEAHGRKPGHGSQVTGAALVFPLTAKEQPKIARLARAHAEIARDVPVFARPIPAPFLSSAAAGLLAVRLHAELLALAPSLLRLAGDLSTPAALQALGFLAEAYVATGRAKEGLELLRPKLTPATLRLVKHPADPLVITAVLCVQGGDPALAVSLLRQACAVDKTPVHLRALRAVVLDDPRLEPLFPRTDFRQLYEGFPAWLARLDRVR